MCLQRPKEGVGSLWSWSNRPLDVGAGSQMGASGREACVLASESLLQPRQRTPDT